MLQLVGALLAVPVLGSSNGLCPARVGNGEVTLHTCGNAACRTTLQLPLGELFEMCDPCADGPLRIKGKIRKIGSMFELSLPAMGYKGSFSCGSCHSWQGLNFYLDCDGSAPSGGLGTVTVTLPVVTIVAVAGIVVVLLAICGVAAFFVMKRRTAQFVELGTSSGESDTSEME